MRLVTLVTDFGLRDEYVGVMKGVAAGIDPTLTIVDITHGIEAQDVVHGAFVLAAACDYFPAGTVHLAVVDPGVGSARRILAVETDRFRFVAPDNGLLERVLACRSIQAMVAVENRRFFLDRVSRTFHGRDIFMPVAAHLAAGVPLAELGPAIDPQSMVSGVVPGCRIISDERIDGAVVAADRFGNLLTTIDAASVDALVRSACGRQITVVAGQQVIHGLAASYDAVATHAPLAIIGSRGLLEISINGGSAQDTLGLGKTDPVRVTLGP